MQTSFRCRSARLTDAAAIADFNCRLAWETEGWRLDPATVRTGVDAALRDPAKGLYFVAERQGGEGEGEGRGGSGLIGQCCVTCEWSDWRNGMFWWLQSVYVDLEGRRRGVFTALFDHVLEEARRAGVIGVRLYVEKENRSAQTVYERRGMQRARYDVFERML